MSDLTPCGRLEQGEALKAWGGIFELCVGAFSRPAEVNGKMEAAGTKDRDVDDWSDAGGIQTNDEKLRARACAAVVSFFAANFLRAGVVGVLFGAFAAPCSCGSFTSDAGFACTFLQPLLLLAVLLAHATYVVGYSSLAGWVPRLLAVSTSMGEVGYVATSIAWGASGASLPEMQTGAVMIWCECVLMYSQYILLLWFFGTFIVALIMSQMMLRELSANDGSWDVTAATEHDWRDAESARPSTSAVTTNPLTTSGAALPKGLAYSSVELSTISGWEDGHSGRKNLSQSSKRESVGRVRKDTCSSLLDNRWSSAMSAGEIMDIELLLPEKIDEDSVVNNPLHASDVGAVENPSHAAEELGNTVGNPLLEMAHPRGEGASDEALVVIRSLVGVIASTIGQDEAPPEDAENDVIFEALAQLHTIGWSSSSIERMVDSLSSSIRENGAQSTSEAAKSLADDVLGSHKRENATSDAALEAMLRRVRTKLRPAHLQGGANGEDEAKQRFSTDAALRRALLKVRRHLRPVATDEAVRSAE